MQAEALQERVGKMRQRLDLSLTSSWRSFEDFMACLVASNALEAGSLKALPLGDVARQIHGDNELWLAMVLTHPAVQVCTSALQDVSDCMHLSGHAKHPFSAAQVAAAATCLPALHF